MNTQAAYIAAITARADKAKASDKTSASNIKKMNNMIETLSTSTELAKLFIDSDVDSSVFHRAIYANAKLIFFSAEAVRHKHANTEETMYNVFRTAINCYRNNEVLYKSDCKAACSRHIEVSDERKALIYVDAVRSDLTVNAQHQTALDTLRNLNIAIERRDLKDAYDIKLNAIAIALCEHFKLDYSVIERDEDESEDEAA